MNKINFTSYAVLAPGYAPGIAVADHTFVVSNIGNEVVDNWNCWGRGKETINNDARQLSQGTAFAEWGRLIYGTDPNFPTGLMAKVEGVCQNASNRLLVLTGVDVAAANANFLTILLYGKYGYHIDDFVKNVTTAAATINQQQPGAITVADLQTVLERIAEDPADELKTLEDHFQSRLPTRLSTSQNEQLMGFYRDFQAKRQRLFDEKWPNRNAPNFQQNYATLLKPVLFQCLIECAPILGLDFKALSQQVSYLL